MCHPASCCGCSFLVSVSVYQLSSLSWALYIQIRCIEAGERQSGGASKVIPVSLFCHGRFPFLYLLAMMAVDLETENGKGKRGGWHLESRIRNVSEESDLRCSALGA